MTRRSAARPAFTLIELIVVIAIVILLATLAIRFLPNLDRNKGVANGATQLQGYIAAARNTAIKNGQPYGLRFFHDGSGRATSVAYIEQPEPVAPRGTNVILRIEGVTVPPAQPPRTVATLYNVSIPATPVPMPWDNIRVGDFLECTGHPSFIARITAVNGATLDLDRVVDGTVVPSFLPLPAPQYLPGVSFDLPDGFRVIRAPRQVVGEPLMHLHKDIFIDLKNTYPCPIDAVAMGLTPDFPGYFLQQSWSPSPIPLAERVSPGDVNYMDILFNSSGHVANATTGQVILFVRHTERPNDALLVVIYTRTGKVVAHGVNDDAINPDPYLFARDGRGSGL